MINTIMAWPVVPQVLAVVVAGMIGWLIAVWIVCALDYLKRRISKTIAHKYMALTRENARLRRHISELRKECLCGKRK